MRVYAHPGGARLAHDEPAGVIKEQGGDAIALDGFALPLIEAEGEGLLDEAAYLSGFLLLHGYRYDGTEEE